ncbi:uncharacterized protein with ATP-grasp and redox domains [Methanomicrobium sp. W14]|uniref:damage-control phosphatase ARMT1 family protein n=1 Tax=Methanomicrobium sp. W14 TaxID=2817839 RepID=UPI001AE3E62F|nr:ARMT1-like domain-containing protein [Methanomicrobium sp. W14]MBP2132724.1 uncharacterized protein with ATP-grasp and redox domains [Methanomicrobium sp. W14]
MKLTEKCFECLLTRIEYECRIATSDEDKIKEILDECHLQLTGILSENMPSPAASSRIHRTACLIVENEDPYREIKFRSNLEAKKVLDKVEDKLITFRDIVLASVIANTFDYGSKEHKVTDDFSGFFYEEFKKGLNVDDTAEIENLCQDVVYLCDNCGEIVFDKKLIEYLKSRNCHVTVVLKGKPVINDATKKDALEIGLDRIADNVYTSTDGISEVGINFSLLPAQVRDAINSSTLIISKGMANYESLSEYKKTMNLPPVAYLMMVKCEPVAENISIPKGSRIACLER